MAGVILEVQIRLEETSYQVSEGNLLQEVCVVLIGEVDTSIEVTLTTSDITATCKSAIDCVFPHMIS